MELILGGYKNMNYKKSAAILSLLAVPVAVTTIADAPVQASQSSKEQIMISHSWVNPHHIYDGALKKSAYTRVASLGTIAANTVINTTTVEELKQPYMKILVNIKHHFLLLIRGIQIPYHRILKVFYKAYIQTYP